MAKIGISAKIGDKYTIRLDKFCIIDGHDDSIPYRARVLINGAFVGTISNDGWGGISDFSPASESVELCREFNSYGADYALYPEEVVGKYATLIGSMPITIEDICDVLAYVEACRGRDVDEMCSDNRWDKHFFTVNGNEWTLHYDRKIEKE